MGPIYIEPIHFLNVGKSSQKLFHSKKMSVSPLPPLDRFINVDLLESVQPDEQDMLGGSQDMLGGSQGMLGDSQGMLGDSQDLLWLLHQFDDVAAVPVAAVPVAAAREVVLVDMGLEDDFTTDEEEEAAADSEAEDEAVVVVIDESDSEEAGRTRLLRLRMPNGTFARFSVGLAAWCALKCFDLERPDLAAAFDFQGSYGWLDGVRAHRHFLRKLLREHGLPAVAAAREMPAAISYTSLVRLVAA